MQDDEGPLPARIHPLEWAWAQPASAPMLASEDGPWHGALMRAWRGTAPVMVQPPLDQHYLVMHLGGAKRVTRRGDGPVVTSIVEEQSITLVPAGSANVWRTEGPIAFAHLYIPPATLEATIDHDFDSEGRDATLTPRVGCRDAFLEPLVATMLHEAARVENANALRLDCLYEAVRRRLAARHSTHRPRSTGRVVTLAPHRLRQVVEFIDANLAQDIRLGDLAAVTTCGQSHFSHAFQTATGRSPYQFVLRQRIEFAKVLLLTSHSPLEEIAQRCGFRTRDQLSRMFKHLTGMNPRRFRGGA